MTITCATCQNTDFYEDAEGQLSCTLCGIQSQDFLAISNDLDENINDTRNEKRKWQRQKATSSRERNVSKQENISSKVYIEVFQYCLKLFVSSMPHDSNRLLGQVKQLWVILCL